MASSALRITSKRTGSISAARARTGGADDGVMGPIIALRVAARGRSVDDGHRRRRDPEDERAPRAGLERHREALWPLAEAVSRQRDDDVLEGFVGAEADRPR